MSTPASPSLRYLSLVDKSLRRVRSDAPKLTDMAERMAKPLLAGGALFTPTVAPFWYHEFNNRAGGMMGLSSAHYQPQSSRDVAYFALRQRGEGQWDPAKDERLRALLKSKARLFVIGRPEELEGVAKASRFEGFTGGARWRDGLYEHAAFKPFAPLKYLDQIVRGWCTGGELIAACTRAGKMPVLWMSVWLEGAISRNASFTEHNNRREPWHVPLFHEDWYVPPMERGYAAGAFLDSAEVMRSALVRQSAKLAQAGQWFAQARQQKKRAFMVAVGHSYPGILDLPKEPAYPIQWGSSVSDLMRAFPRDLSKGDVAMHLGYAPVRSHEVASVLKRGFKLIHSSPYGRPKDLPEHPNFIWLDLPWRPADATVDILGYSVRMCPMSSTAHTMTYNAVLCEMAERLGWT